MSTKTVKQVSVVLDENELWMLSSVMKDFYYAYPNLADHDKVRDLYMKIRMEARKSLGL
jgi:hypothetical protein